MMAKRRYLSRMAAYKMPKPTRMATYRERAGLINPNDRKIYQTWVPENPLHGHACDDCSCVCHDEPGEAPFDPLGNDYRDD
jgi:hypothetical protein